MIDLQHAWSIFLRNAQMYLDTGYVFNSPANGHQYSIASISDNNAVRVQRANGTYDTIGWGRIETAIGKVNAAGGMLPKTGMVTGPVIVEATIVELLPGILEWEGERGNMRIVDVSTLISAEEIPEELQGEASELDLTDYRRRVNAEVNRRLKQGRLRNELLMVYDYQCCISGCTLLPVLQASHLIPFKESGNQHSRNAIVLRSDLHDLFDAFLIGIHPDDLTIHVSVVVTDSTYREFDQKKLKLRNDGRSIFHESLMARWKLYANRQ